MASETSTNFLGIPIEGDIVRSSSAKPQRPLEELQEEIAKLLEFKSFTALRWRQYTPYFNDGDPCVFSISAGGLLGPDPTAGDYEDGFHDVSYGYSYDYLNDKAKKFYGRYDRGTYNRDTRQYEGGGWVQKPKHPKMIDQAKKVLDMVGSGSYNDALMQLFGDHATVTLHRDKIEVEFYDHD